LHFEVGVEGEGVRAAEFVDLYGVVYHQLGRKQRIDFFRVAAELLDGVAHRGEIDDGRHAREVLQQDARGHEGDFLFGGARGARRIPACEGANVVRVDEAIVFVAQKIFEQHLQRKGQVRDVTDLRGRELVQTIDFERIAADAKGRAGRE